MEEITKYINEMFEDIKHVVEDGNGQLGNCKKYLNIQNGENLIV